MEISEGDTLDRDYGMWSAGLARKSTVRSWPELDKEIQSES
jgi:hypothetical protein